MVPSAGRDEGPTSEPDETLVDECCLLPSQLLIPSLDWLPVSDGLVSRLQPKQPLRLHFGKAPVLPSSATTLQLDGLIRCVPSASRPFHILSGGFPPLNLPTPSCFRLRAVCCACCFLLTLTQMLSLGEVPSLGSEFPPPPPPSICHFSPVFFFLYL